MKAMVEHLVSETPRPRSPHMNNEEPIELAHYPAAKPPRPEEQAKIERDDFPAPPYPYTDPGNAYFSIFIYYACVLRYRIIDFYAYREKKTMVRFMERCLSI